MAGPGSDHCGRRAVCPGEVDAGDSGEDQADDASDAKQIQDADGGDRHAGEADPEKLAELGNQGGGGHGPGQLVSGEVLLDGGEGEDDEDGSSGAAEHS